MAAPGGASGLLVRMRRQADPLAGSVIVMVLPVDVISDVICPWCYIGKRRLEKAVAALDGQHEVRVCWLPFQLNPTRPKEEIRRREYRTRKFGSRERLLDRGRAVLHRQRQDHAVRCPAAEGISG